MTAVTSVLLTGATGSLGGQLCAVLLTATPASVHCLVRASDDRTARDRVLARLSQLEDPPPPPSHRLTAIHGDLEHPTLGLSSRGYDALAETTDTIMHCAAQVDLAAGYGRLATANVTATRHLLDLAGRRARLTGRPVAFHYISTLGTFLNARATGLATVDEASEVSEATSGPLGYPRSKAAAEILLRHAQASGQPVSIYRPAIVTGHSRTGRTSASDLLTPLLWAAAALGTAPAPGASLWAERVDVVARSVVTLMSSPRAAGRAFHLVNPQPLPLAALTGALRRAGYPVTAVPARQWWRQVTEQADHPAVHPLAAISEVAKYLLAFDEDHTTPDVSSSQTWQQLASHGMTPAPLDEAFLDRLVSRLNPPGLTRQPRVMTAPRAEARTPPGPASPVRIDGCLTPLRFRHDGAFPDPQAAARACQAAGYGMLWAQEQNHDPVAALAAAAAVSSIAIGTNVLVALARSPMAVAHTAHDLHAMSQGRFTLGLGPQFAANLTYRYSVPADRRLDRLRDYVAALRAIWASWNENKPLAYRGEFYTHTLTSPFFTPPPSLHGPPPIYLAATGPRMAELAGEIADGLAAPPYATRDHLTQVLLPAAERGLARSGRTRQDFTVSIAPLIITGPEDAAQARSLVALWCGTRAYRPLFDRYQLGSLADQLAQLSLSTDPDRSGRMTDMIDDRMLDLFAISAPGRLGAALHDKFSGHADRIILPAPLGRYTSQNLGITLAGDATLTRPAGQ